MIESAEVEQLLIADLGWSDAHDIGIVGAGAWSTAFGFVSGDEHLVIRVGTELADFERDAAMAEYASPGLPIPRVHGVGELSDASLSYYCISDRVFGEPLELCHADDWPAVASHLAQTLEVMRSIGQAESDASPSWHRQLMAIEFGDYDARMPGWRDKLAESTGGAATYAAAVDRLRDGELFDVPLTLIHGDLINRNVHVRGTQITGIFDWGCQRWGDHLFELAWFEFWEPWHQNLDIDILRRELADRWSDVERADERRWASLAQIGIDHLAYNAWANRPNDLIGVIERMESLDLV